MTRPAKPRKPDEAALLERIAVALERLADREIEVTCPRCQEVFDVRR